MAKLTAAQVKHAKQGRHGDGRGLYLQVIGGSKTWLLRYKHQRRERWMGLGSVEFVTLAEAREQAFQLRCKLKREKIDPLEARRALQVGARLAALNGATFEQVARQYVEVRAMAKKWRGDGDALRPLVGDRPCGARLGRSRRTHEGREGAQGAVVRLGAGDPRGASARRRD
jgi:Arm DNA-binding domain